MVPESKTPGLLIVILVLLLAAGVFFVLLAAPEAEAHMVEADLRHAESAELHEVIEQQQAEIEALRKELGRESQGGTRIRRR